MNDLLEPPAERNLPPARAARIRTELLTAARQRRPRVSRRLLLAAAAVLVGIAVLPSTARNDRHEVLAMSTAELDRSLRGAVRDCLEAMEPRDDGAPEPAFVPVTAADVAVVARRGTRIGVLFLTEAGYMTCDMEGGRGWFGPGSLGVGGEAWPQRDWLPGPVQRLSLTSTGQDSGAVTALGRVSARVDRLVLEHGNGRTTTARIRDGAFGLISAGDDVGPDAELVSYDRSGREIGRRSLFAYSGDHPHCYTDPDGTVVYGKPGPRCLPADPWTR